MIDRKRTWFELAIVFALSLGASAVYSLVSLLAKLTAPGGLAGSSSSINPSMASREWLDATYQLLSIFFGLAPVALALFLLYRANENPFEKIGLSFKNFKFWSSRGLALAAVIGVPGILLYLGARALGLSSQVIAADLGEYWWTIPVLLLAAAKAGLLEEVLVVAYLFERLEALGFSIRAQLLISALLRASYHLYQGFAGFFGNLVMGLVFGWAYKRFGRIMPLVFAHFLLDAFAFVGYALFAGMLPL